MKTNKLSFIAATTWVSGLNLVTHLVMAGRDLCLAYFFGASGVMDSYVLAYTIPLFVINIFSYAYVSAILPDFVKIREKDEVAARVRLREIFGQGISMILMACAFLLILRGPLVQIFASGFSDEKKDMAALILIPLIFVVALSSWNSLLRGVLNSEHRFLNPSINLLLNSVLTVIVIITLQPRFGIFAVPVGLLAGQILEWNFLYLAIRKSSYSQKPIFKIWQKQDWQVIALFGPLTFSTLLMNSTTLVDQSMAAILSGSGVAALSYGGKVVSFVVGIFGGALTNVTFTHFNEFVSQKKWSEFRRLTHKSILIIFAIGVPLTLFLVYFTDGIAQILFLRGAFSQSDLKLVATIQAYFFLQLPFYLSVLVLLRALNALQKNRVILYVSLLNVLLNVIGNLIFIDYFGIAGIALSTSFVYIFSCLLLLYYVDWELRRYVCK
jgi:putative peptidoglycan lipid II flippase